MCVSERQSSKGKLALDGGILCFVCETIGTHGRFLSKGVRSLKLDLLKKIFHLLILEREKMEEREKEKDQFVVPLIYACIG